MWNIFITPRKSTIKIITTGTHRKYSGGTLDRNVEATQIIPEMRPQD
jgi:hypothetical protein